MSAAGHTTMSQGKLIFWGLRYAEAVASMKTGVPCSEPSPDVLITVEIGIATDKQRPGLITDKHNRTKLCL
jgi:hypothetical protein